MVAGSTLKQIVANVAARAALRFPILEGLLLFGTRRPFLRRHLRLGAIALGYPRVLQRRELRLAEMNGYRFYVNVGESLGVEPYFFGESGTVWLTRSLVNSGDVCVDAGANVGHYTFFLSSVVGPHGKVFAFEPNPEFASLVERSIALNAFEEIISVSTCALWSISGEKRRFFISNEPTNSGTSSLVQHGLFLSQDHTIEVQTIRFDDFMERAGVKTIRLLKVDVERAEDHLLEGAQRSLEDQRIDYLIVEMYSGERAQQLLVEAGYAGYFIAEQLRQIVPLAAIPNGRFGDYLFVRPGLAVPESNRPRAH